MEESSETDEMHDALKSIAFEVIRFKSEMFTNASHKIRFRHKPKWNCRAKPRSKRQAVAKLRMDIKLACWVTKKLQSDKKREIASLVHKLMYARRECVDLLEKYKKNIDIITIQHKQNESLYEKMQSLSNFVHLGYKELRKIEPNSKEEHSTLGQLKQLIECCGQFYADYTNQYKLNYQIKQKNRYLTNKLSILENNIAAIKENLKAMEYRNLRLAKANNKISAKIVRPTSMNFKVAYSKVNVTKSEDDESSSYLYKECGDSSQDFGKDLDFASHFEIVKRLLSDQDNMLKDLTIISKEISVG